VANVFAPTDFAADAKPRTRAAAGAAEMRVAALCLAQFSEPLFAAIAQSQGLTEPPGYARIFFLPVYGFLLWAILRQTRAALTTALATPLLMALIALAFVSTTWSIDSGGTLRRSVWLALTMAFGLYLAWRYDWARMVQVIAGAFAVLVIGSFATTLIAPSVGIMPFEHPGAWSGLWTHKNTLGGLMALGVPIGVTAAIVAPERRKLWLATACGAFVLVLLSTSKTALLASMIGLAVIAAGALIRRGPLYAIVIATGASALLIITASAFLLAPEAIVAAFGRDLTFTGRTDIWHAAASAVDARPWLGYGYYAFWLDENGPAYWIRQAVRWEVASAHNGWLELALGLGRIGITLFALQFIATLYRGARSVMDRVAGLWAPAFLAAFTLYNLSESHAVQANDLFWTIYVAVAARLALDARARKEARA
jgi:O-antigen ligase